MGAAQTLLLIAALGSVPANAQTTPGSTAASTGALIVKFKSESAPGRTVAAVREQQRRAGTYDLNDGRLRRLVGELSSRARLPLALKQISSGNELVLAIDTDGWARQLAQRFRQAPGTTSITIAKPGSRGPEPFLDIRVMFERSGAAPDDIAGSLRQILTTHPTVVIDLSAARYQFRFGSVVAELARRLAADGRVAYVQPNLILRAHPQLREIQPVR